MSPGTDDLVQQFNSVLPSQAPATQAAPQQPAFSWDQFTQGGQYINFANDRMKQAMQGAAVGSDEDITNHSAVQAKAYGDTLEKRFPGMDRKKAEEGFRSDLAQNLQGQLLQQHIKNETDYLNSGYSGYFGRRAGIADIIGKIPGAKEGFQVGSAIEMNKAVDAIQAGKASSEQYKMIAEQVARKNYDTNLQQRLGQGQATAALQTGWDIASQLPSEIAEWMAFTGPAKAAGAVGAEGVAKIGGGAVSQAVGEYVTRLAARQALQSYKVAPEVAQGMTPQVQLQDGRVQTAQGEDITGSFKKAWLSQLYANAAFEASGAYEPKPGMGAAGIALSTAKAVGATQAASEASYRLGGGGGGSVLTQLANARSDDEKNQILAHFAVESGVFGLLETRLHGKGKPEHESPKPADVIQSMRVRLQAEGVPANAWDTFIANSIAKAKEAKATEKPSDQPTQEPPTEPAQSTQGPVAPQAVPAESPTQAPAPQPAPAPEATPPKGPFEHLTGDEVSQLSKQLTGKELRSPAGLAAELKRRGLSDAGIAGLSDATKAPGKPAPPTTPPESITAPQSPEGPITRQEPPPVGQKTPWHDAYAQERASGKTHDAATDAADKAHPDGQTWVHSGTKFEPDGQTYSNREGEKFLVGNDEPINGSMRVQVQNASGKEVASVSLGTAKDGTVHGTALKSESPGAARAMYDYVTEKLGVPLVPEARAGEKGEGRGIGQTAEGSKFWQQNAEFATGIRKPGRGPLVGPRRQYTAPGLTPFGKVEGRVETGPGQSLPQEPTQTAEQYAVQMKKAMLAKGYRPDVVENVVSESGATSKRAWRTWAEENDVPFAKNSTAMHYADALVDHWNSPEYQASEKAELNDGLEDFKAAGASDRELQVANRLLRGMSLRDAGEEIGFSYEQVRQDAIALRQKLADHFGAQGDKVKSAWDRVVASAEAEKAKGQVAVGETPQGISTKRGREVLKTDAEHLLDQINAVDNEYDRAASEAQKKGKKMPPEQEQAFNEQLQELSRRLETARAQPQQFPNNNEPTPVRSVGGEAVQGSPTLPENAPQVAPASQPQQAVAPAGPTQAASPNPADAGPPPAPAGGGEAPGGFLASEAGSTDIYHRLFDYAHDLFRKFVPETEAPDETAEVQAAAREAARLGGLSKSAADAAAQSLIAEANAKAHEAALDQFANELRGQAGRDNTSPGEPATGGQSTGDGVLEFVSGFLRDERGYLDPAVLGTYATNFIDRARAFGRGIGDELDKLSSRSFPATTRLARVVGEKLSQYISKDVFVHEAVPRYIDKAFGEKATPEQINLHWTTMAEERLRYGKQQFLAKSAEGSQEADAARQQAATLRQQAAAATDPAIQGALRHQASLADKAASDGAQKATEYQQKYQEAKDNTMIGPDSPLKSEADYQTALNSPEYKATLGAGGSYEKQVVPDMDRNFKMATGMDENDQIDTLTQLPGRPMNLMKKDAEIGGTGPAAGNPKNLKIQKYVFAREAGLNGEYETDGAKSLENTFNRGYGTARKADAYRTAEANGIGQWAEPGRQIEGFKELPFTKPPTGTQNAEPGDVFYVHNDAYSEWRQALSIDEPFKIPGVTQMSNSLSWIALRSTVEAAYHVRNLLTILTKPGVNPIDLFKNGMKIFKGDPATADQLVNIARIGAGKEHIDGSAANPLLWSRKFLDFADKVTRLTANDAFDNLKKMGHDAETTETARRDFINQIAGQYNTRAQSKLVAWLRSTGIGPFATAGMNYYMNGLKSLILDPGVKAESWKGALALRTEVMARQAVLLGTVALVNYLAWGRADGDDSTPLGSIKTGAGPDGKTRYFDFASLMSPIPRGMRETGLAALTEGVRRGQPASEITDKAKWDAVEAAIHPILGPPGQFAYTAVTGKNTLGMKVASPTPPGGSESWQNLKAAVANANPAVGTLTGSDRPGEAPPLLSRGMQLSGPFNPIKERNNPVVSDFYDQFQRAQQVHQQVTQNRQKGLVTPGYDATQAMQYRRLEMGNQRMMQLNKAMRAAKDDATKARIRALQVQVASSALGR